jgi:hypothetical protein
LLLEITLNESLKRIEGRAFEYNPLTHIEIPNSVTYIGGMLFNECDRLKSVKFGNRVDTIGYGVCYDCDSLESVIIPNSCKELGAYAFYRCRNLTSVILGNSLETIGNTAFRETALTSVTSLNLTPPLGYADIFDRRYDVATLYVPNSVVETYRTAYMWEQFTNIVGIEVDTKPGDMNGDDILDIDDVTIMISMLLNGEQLPSYADLNGDETVDIDDVTLLISKLLGN